MDQQQALYNSTIGEGDAIDTARADLNKLLHSQQSDSQGTNLRNWSAAELLQAAVDPAVYDDEILRPTLSQALMKKTAQVYVALNDLSRKNGLTSEDLSIIDAHIQVVDTVLKRAGSDGDTISIPAKLLKDATDSYRTFSGKEFAN